MQINGLFAAKPKPFGPRGAPSSIEKLPTAQLTVSVDGTSEDEQGNKKLHGGPEKVLHQYGLSGYRTLSEAFPHKANEFVPGAIGENISVVEMDDTNVQVGDIYRMGGVVVQVSAPRAPCNKISHRFDEKNLDQLVGRAGFTGWYYRVLETGIIRMGDEIHHLERPAESISVHELVRVVFAEDTTYADALYASGLASLDNEWRDKCKYRARKLQRE